MHTGTLAQAGFAALCVCALGCSGTMRSERVADESPTDTTASMDYPLLDDTNPQALDDPAARADGNEGAVMSHEFAAPDASDVVAQPQAPAVADASPSNAVIDINVATVEQLDALPGIELPLAQSIVAFRNRSGVFLNVDELLMVQGMTAEKLDRIRSQITVAKSAQ